MVKIEELKLDDSDDGFVTESEISSNSGPSEADLPDANSPEDEEDEDLERALKLYNIQDETIADRIYALRDIVNPSTRAAVCHTWKSFWTKSSAATKTLGNFAWVVTTSVLLVGLPLALSIEGESMLVAHEKEMERQQQGQQPLTAPSGGNSTAGERTAVVPTGF